MTHGGAEQINLASHWMNGAHRQEQVWSLSKKMSGRSCQHGDINLIFAFIFVSSRKGTRK